VTAIGPDIRYARSGGTAIAYQVVGEGDTDLVWVHDFVSNLVYGWESPHMRAFYERLARSFRLILFDKRGVGLSDYGGQLPTFETRMEDMRSVLDAVGSENAVLLGSHDGCSMAILYAATYPERVRALVLFHPFMHLSDEDREESLAALPALRENWGTQEFSDGMLSEIGPTLFANEADRRWFANWLRVGASPQVAYALNRGWMESDIRDVTPAVRVPTLVLYRSSTFYEQYSLDTAALIPGAQARRVSGTDGWGIFLSPEIPEEVERFVAGERAPSIPDTVLATLLFTDIVRSTERAAALGDTAWRELLERHHALVRRELARFRGEERDTAGDGFFATFDGPARAIRCAESVVAGVRELGLEIRAGVHTGECELHDAKVAGIAVSIGARVAALAGPGEVAVSQTVKDLVAGSGIDFSDMGVHELKGVPGEWRVYAVNGSPP